MSRPEDAFGIIPQVSSTLAFGNRVSAGLKAGWAIWLASPRDPSVSSAGITGACSVSSFAIVLDVGQLKKL